jgi:hypothetical protein
MELLILNITCPNCGTTDCRKEFNYNNLQERAICLKCGYRHAVSYKEDGEGDLIGRDDLNGFIEESLCIEEEIISKPFGCFIAVDEDGERHPWTVVNESDYNDYLDWFLNAHWVRGIIFNQYINKQFYELKVI